MATFSGGCRQTLQLHQAPALAGVPPAEPTHSAAAVRLDARARWLHLALLLLTRPLAAAARTFIDRCGWKEFGYARLSDHARERLDRSAGWLRDLAALDEAVERLPALAAALTGEDGGTPLGLVAARCLGKVASRDSLSMWISIARTHPVRELKILVGRALAAGSSWPVAQQETSDEDTLPHDEPRRRVHLLVPAAVREAFTEVLELYRAVEGHAAPVGEFVDDLLAEVASGPLAGKADPEILHGDLTVVRPGRKAGEAPPVNTATLNELPAPGRTTAGQVPAGAAADTCHDDSVLRGRVHKWLGEVLGRSYEIGDCWSPQPSHAPRTSVSTPCSTPAAAADAHMRRLLALHDGLERRLAETVTTMDEACAWQVTGFGSLHAYTREILGWSRSTTYERLRLVRLLRRLPLVQQAFRQGRIGQVAARTIAGLLTREAADGTIPLTSPAGTQKAWVERAAAATVRRLQDESRAVTRLLVLGQQDREPLPDSAWLGSLKRRAGMTRARVESLTRMALLAPGPLLPLELSLEAGTADRLLQTLEVARRDPALVQTFRSGGRDKQEDDPLPAPAWAALLALLQEFAATWDVDLAGRRPWARKIYNRDGWRCMAPGCTSRQNLEVHHVVYRSQGGNDRPENLVCLCRFHHQMGEHGLLAKVQGAAPLNLTWTLGRDGKGGRFRNDLRLAT